MNPDSDVTVVKEIGIVGFDPDAEPVIREMSDNSLYVQFEAMPPFFAEDLGTEWDDADFQSRFELVVGKPVIRDDREVFIVTDPADGTIDVIKTWLETYPKQ